MIKKILLTSITSFSELFTADQIWGQFIWAISDLYGKEKASSVVEEYKTNPPILFSSMLIDGFLPKPFFVNTIGDSDSDIMKHNKKCQWLDYRQFRELQRDCNYCSGKKLDIVSVLSSRSEIHASIDRETMRTLDEGGVYNSQYLYTKNDVRLAVYVNFLSKDNKWESILDDVISLWNKIGLGGDRNVGHGQFKIEICELSKEEEEIFLYKDKYYVSLSNCFGSDLAPISYNVDVYSGIIGRATSNINAYRKKPIIRFKTGSLFLDGGKGMIAENVAFDSNICSYGYAFPIYMNYEGTL